MTIIDDWDEGPPLVPTWHVGDRVRIVRQEGILAQGHIGQVGTVVAVYSPPSTSMVVHPHAVEAVVVVDFGPDEDGPGGRDTRGYADADVEAADTPTPPRKRRKGR
jgi:hypothetical protein